MADNYDREEKRKNEIRERLWQENEWYRDNDDQLEFEVQAIYDQEMRDEEDRNKKYPQIDEEYPESAVVFYELMGDKSFYQIMDEYPKYAQAIDEWMPELDEIRLMRRYEQDLEKLGGIENTLSDSSSDYELAYKANEDLSDMLNTYGLGYVDDENAIKALRNRISSQIREYDLKVNDNGEIEVEIKSINPELTPEQLAEDDEAIKASEEFDREVRDDSLGKDESSLEDTENR